MNIEEARRELAALQPGARLLEFLAALESAGEVRLTSEISSFFEKPYNYAREYVAWMDAGRPMDYSEDGWDEFLNKLNEGSDE